MSAIMVSTRYATALLQQALEEKVLDTIYSDVRLLEQTVEANRDLLLMFRSPIVNSGTKIGTVREIYEGKVNPLTMKFLLMLIRKRREAQILDIISAFYEEYNDYKKIKEVELISAVPLSSELESKILESINKQFAGVTLQINKSVNPELLGGIVVKVDDKVYDTSLHNKLNALRREILAS